jgi:hypothetical protein
MSFTEEKIDVNKELLRSESSKTKGREIPTIMITEKNYAELKKEGVAISDNLKDFSEGVYKAKILNGIISKKLIVFVFPNGISEINNLPQIIEPAQYFIKKTLERLNVVHTHGRIQESVYEEQKRLLQYQSDCNPAFLESKTT